MKLTKNHLKQIIKEELEIILAEQTFEDLPEGPHTIPCSAGCRKEKGKLVSHKPNFKPTIYLGNGFCSGECVESPLEHPRSVSQKCAEEMTPKEIKTMRDLGIPLRRCKTKGRVGRRTPEPTPRPKRKKPPFEESDLDKIAKECEGFTCPFCWEWHYDDVHRLIMCALKRRVSYEEVRYYIENPDAARQLNIPFRWKARELLEKLEQLNVKVFYNELSDACKKKLKVWTEKRWHSRGLTRYLCGRSVLPKREPEIFEEVYSKKQRKYMCAQASKPASKRPKGLSKKEAQEMCRSKKLKKKKRKSKK